MIWWGRLAPKGGRQLFDIEGYWHWTWGVLSFANSVGASLEMILHLWGQLSPHLPPFQSPYKTGHTVIFRLFITKSGINLSPQLHVSCFDLLYFSLTQRKRVFWASILSRWLLTLLLLDQVWRSFCYPVPCQGLGLFPRLAGQPAAKEHHAGQPSLGSYSLVIARVLPDLQPPCHWTCSPSSLQPQEFTSSQGQKEFFLFRFLP